MNSLEYTAYKEALNALTEIAAGNLDDESDAEFRERARACARDLLRKSALRDCAPLKLFVWEEFNKDGLAIGLAKDESSAKDAIIEDYPGEVWHLGKCDTIDLNHPVIFYRTGADR